MTVARGAALGALALAVVVVAVLVLSTGASHRYELVFENAGQLVKGDDVQVGGRRVGSVTEISLTPDNLAQVTVNVDDGYAPLHRGTQATVRATSLSGIANRYIALSLGPNNAPKLDDGAHIGLDATTSIVDLDQLFDTFTPKTLKGLQQVVQGSANQFQGRTTQANEAAKYLNPALSTTARLVNELNRDTNTFTSFLLETSRTVTALASRRSDLTDLVSNANATSGAIAAESSSLSLALDRLPPTLRRANTTFVDLRNALDDLDVLVNASKPATKRLAPFLRELRPLVAQARPTIRDLRLAIRRPGSNNDLVEIMRKLPRLGSLAETTFPRAVRTLRRSQPVLDFFRPYTTELVGWFRDYAESAAFYDANGHYARIQPILGPFSAVGNSSGTATTLTPIPSLNDRLAGFDKYNFARCPGGATQRRPDSGNPWRDTGGGLDCNPADRPHDAGFDPP
jgi:phospholipid/cholesterol/gamma-HCH transport system substrate-binding protein